MISRDVPAASWSGLADEGEQWLIVYRFGVEEQVESLANEAGFRLLAASRQLFQATILLFR